MQTFYWSIIKQSGGRGLNHIEGTVQAHTAKEARAVIDREIADYARQALVMGDYLLIVRTGRRAFRDRHIHIHCSKPHLVA